MKFLKTTTALGLVLCAAASLHAQTVSAPASQPPVRPTDTNTGLDVTPTGTPIVNIAAPDRNGVSYNRYNQFDVNTEGLIINNSRSVGSTVLGGQILANPNLRNSNSASLILNEVVSSNRSDLYGPIEIFGPTAAFILANEAGITCDGCGFINISRVALSSGKITFGSDGEFTGFAVAGGDVRVDGDGLLAGNVDFFDIVTSTASFNASLYARDLVIAGGNGQYDYNNRTATSSDNAARIAIDSSLLGGMFANRIRLIGTSDGVGINLRGTLTVLEGPLEITSGGEIALRNAVVAGDVTLRSLTSNINIDDRLYGGGTVSLNAAGNISQTGNFLAAGADVSLQSGGDTSLSAVGLYAGLSSTGRLEQQGRISIQAAGGLQTSATQLLSTGQQVIDANSINIDSDTAISGGSIAFSATQNVDLAGQLESSSDVNLSARSVNLSGSAVGNGQLRITGDQIAVAGTAIGLAGADIDAAAQFDVEETGSVQTNGTLNIRTGIANNGGDLVGIGGLNIRSFGSLNNNGEILSGQNVVVESGAQLLSSGVISANGAVSINAADSGDLSGNVGSAGSLSIAASELTLSGQLSSGDNLVITSRSDLNISAGSQIVAESDISLSAVNDLSSRALISARGDAELIAGGESIIGGQVQAGRNIALTSNVADISGLLVANTDIGLFLQGNANIFGALSANNSLSINASNITLNTVSRLIANDNIRLITAGQINNFGAISGDDIFISSRDFINFGNLFFGNDILINTTFGIDQSGIIEGNGTIELVSDLINLNGRSVGIGGVGLSGSQIKFSSTNNLQSGGLLSIFSNRDLTLQGNIISIAAADVTTAGNLNQLAEINLGDTGKFTAAENIVNSNTIIAADAVNLLGHDIANNGIISTNGILNLTSLNGNITSSGDLSAGGRIELDAANLIDVSGDLISSGRIGLFTNRLLLDGTINAVGGLEAGLLRQLSIGETGSLLTGSVLALSLDSLDNAGTLFSGNILNLDVASSFTNLGQIISDSSLAINTQGDFANNGVLQARDSIILFASGDAQLAGSITAGSSLDIASGLLSISGTIVANAGLSLSADAVDVSDSGVIFGVASLNAASASDFVTNGLIASGGNAVISAVGRFVQNGELESAGSLLASANSISLNGDISALRGLSVEAGGTADIAGNLSTGAELSVEATDLTISQSARLASNGLLRIAAANLLAVDGTLSSLGQAEFFGRNIAINDPAVIVSDAQISIGAVSNIDHFGQIQARGAVWLAGENLTLSGDISSTGVIGASGSSLQIAGQISSNETIILQGIDAAITGAIAAQNSIDLSFSSGLLLDSGANITSDQDILLESTTADIRGTISALGQFSANTAEQLAIGGSILSATDVRLVAGVLDVAGTVQANNDVVVNVGANTEISGGINAGRIITINSGSANITGNAAANGLLGLNADAIVLSGSLSAGQLVSVLADTTAAINGNIVSNDRISLTATDLSVGLTGRVEAGQLLDADIGSGNIVGLLNSGGNANIRVANNAVLSGNLEAFGDLRLLAGTLQTLNASQLLTNGTLTIDVLGSAVFSGEISSSDIGLSVGGELANNGLIYSAGDLTVDAAALRNNSILASAGNVTIGAADIRLGLASDLQSGGALSLSAIDRLDLAGSILAVDDANFDSTSDILQNAEIRFGNDGIFSSGGSLTQNGTIIADGNVDLIAATIVGPGNIRANGSLSLATNLGDIDYTGGLIALGNIDAISGGRLRLTGTVETNEILALTSSDIRLDGNVVGLGGVSVHSGAALSIGISGALRSGSALDLNLLSLANAGLITANDDLSIATQTALHSFGFIAASGDLALAAGSQINLGGFAQADGRVILDAQGDLNLSGVLTALGNVTANANNLSITGSLESEQSVALESASSIEVAVSGQIAADGDLYLTGNGGVTNAGLLSGQQSLWLTSLGNITSSGTVQSANVQNWNGAQINISGNVISLAGLNIAAADLSLDANVSARAAINVVADTIRLTGQGVLIGGAGLTIDAAQSVENFGAIDAVGSVTINSGTLANFGQVASGSDVLLFSTSLQNTGLIEAARILDIGAAQVTLSGDLVGLSALRLSTGDLASAASSRILSDGDIVINSAGDAQLASLILAEDATIASTLGNITLSNEISVGGLLDVSAGGIFRLTGNADAVSSVSIRANQLDLAGNIVTNAGANLQAVGGPINVSGSITADQSVLFSAAGAVDLTGSIQADDSIAIVANSVLVSGDLSGVSQVTVSADGAVSTADGSALLSNGDIVLGGALLDIGGLVSSVSGISLASSGNSFISGNLLSGTTLRISAVDLSVAGNIQADDELLVDLLGNLTTASGSDLLSAQDLVLEVAGNIDAAGNLGSSGNTRIFAGADLNVAGSLQVTEQLALNAGNIAVTGNVASDSGFEITTLGNLHVTGRLTSIGAGNLQVGSLNVEQLSGLNDAVLYTAGDLSIVAVSDIINSGLIGTDNALNLAFGRLFDNRGSLILGTDFTVTTASDLALNGDIFAGGAISLTARDLDVGGILLGEQGFSASARAINIAETGSIESGAALTIDASDGLNIAGSILALGNLDLRAENALIVSQPVILQSVGHLTINSNGLIDSALGSTFRALGNLTLNGSTAELEGDLLSEAALTLNLSGSGALSGLVSAAGPIHAEFDELTLSGELTSESGISFTGRNLSLFGDVYSDLRTDAALTGDFILANEALLSASGGINISSIEQRIAGQIESDNDIALTSQNFFQLAAAGAIVTAAGLTLESSDRLDIAGVILAERRIALRGGTTNIVGLAETNDVLTLQASSLDISGRLSALGTLSVNAGRIEAQTTAEILSNDRIALNASADVVVAGLVDSQGSIVFDILGNLSLAESSEIFASEATDISADNSVNLAGLVSSAERLAVNGNEVTISGELDSDTELLLASRNNLAISGTVLSQGAIGLARSGSFTQSSGLISAGGTLSLNNGLDTNISGIFESTGALTIGGAQTDLFGIIGTSDVLTITASDINITGQLSARQASLTSATGGISLETGGILDTDQSSILTAQNSLTVNGVILAGADAASGNAITLISNGGDVTLGSGARLAATGNVNVAARGSFGSTASELDGDGNALGIEATGNVSIVAAIGSLTSGQILSDGLITLASDGNLLVNAEVNAFGAINATANAGTVRVGSVGALRSEAAEIAVNTTRSLINEGGIAAANGIALTSSADISNSGFVYSADGALSLNARTLLLGGSVYSEGSTGQLALTSNDIQIFGIVSSDAALTINRPQAQLNIAAGGLLQSNDQLTLDLASFDVAGTLRGLSASNISVTSAIVQNSGIIEIDGTLGISATNALTLLGNIVATDSIVTDASQLTQAGEITSINGGILIGVNDQISINGRVDSAGILSISGTDVNLGAGGELLSLSTLSVAASDEFVVNGRIFASGDVTLLGTNSVTVDGIVISNGNLTVLADNGSASLTGRLSSIGSATVTADSVIISNRLASNGDITVTADSGNISIGGIVEAGVDGNGRLTLSASAGDVALSAGGWIYGQNGVAVTGRSVSLLGITDSLGTVNINASVGSIAVNGSINSNSAVSLTTGAGLGQNISIDGRIDGTDISLSAFDLNLGGTAIVQATGTASLRAINSASLAGDVIANGNILFNSGTGGNANLAILSTGSLQSLTGAISLDRLANVNIDGLVSAQNAIDINFANSFRIGSIGRVEAVSYDANGNANGGDIRLTYTGVAGNSGFTTTIDGDLVATRDIAIRGGAINIGGFVSAVRDLNINSNNYALGSLDFGGNNSFDTPISVRVGATGILLSGGNSNIDVIGGLVVDASGANRGYFSATGNANLNAYNHYIAGDIFAGGTLTFTNGIEFVPADSDLSGFYLSGSAQSAGTLTINSTIGAGGTGGSSVDITGSGFLISDSNISITADDIFGHGTIIAADQVALNAGRNIVIGGLVQSNRRVAIDAGSTITILTNGAVETLENAQTIVIGRDQNATTNISLSAANSVLNQGTIYSTGSVALRSNGTVINSSGANITAVGSAILQSNAAGVLNEGAISADTLALYQATNFNNSGSFVASGSLLIDAPNISNSGLIGAGFDLTLSSANNIVNSGTLFAGDNLTANGGGRIHNDEGLILAAFGDINLTAPELFNESSRIEALSGNVTINSGNIVNRIKNLVITPGSGETPGRLVPATGGQEVVGFTPSQCGQLLSNNGIALCSEPLASGALVTVLFTVGVPTTTTQTFVYIAPTLGGDDIVTANSGASQIVAAGDVNIFGGANGTLLNSNSSILAGNNITIATGTVNNVADLVRTTRTEQLPTGRIVERFEDANLDCGQLAASLGPRLVPGSCESGSGSTIFTRWQEFEFADQTVVGEVALPTVIQAGGTVNIMAAQLGNGTVVQNVNVNGGNNPNPNTSVTSANPQGNGANFDTQPLTTVAVRSIPLALNSIANREAVRQDSFAVDAVVNAASVGLEQSNGSGAGAVILNSNGVTAGGNSPGNNGGGANAVSDVTATASSALDVNIAELTTNGAVVGGLGANVTTPSSIAAQIVNGVGAAGANADGLAAAVNANLMLVNVDQSGAQTIGNVIGNVVSAVGGDLADNQLTAIQTRQATTAATAALSNAAATTIVGPDGVTPTIDGIPAQPGLATINLDDSVRLVDPLDDPDTTAQGDEALEAVLIDGFNGIAIQGIIGVDGSAGNFILGFLRQFDLVNSDGGFGFANGNSLFTFDDSPGANFIFTTNRGFGDLGSLFDSDYFFDQLDRDRETYFLRLGDGFFETQLISQQVRAATNQAQLPQFGSALEQAEALMASAVAQQRGLGLTLGVALTSDQVAQLTTSLVWWVSADVGGRTALVPVVYLAVADQKEIQNGSIIAGTNVVARVAGDIRNTGTISASRVVSLTSGNDIVNSNGGLVRGGTVIANAARDIINSGPSSITGGDILLTAGRDVSIIPVTRTESESNFTRTGKRGFTSSNSTNTTVTGGTIAADNALVINAGRDITISSSEITAGGDAIIDAERDVNITGESETSTRTEAWDLGKKRTGKRSNNGQTTTTTSDFVGSNIDVDGQLRVSAGNNVTVTGSNLSADGDLGISAGNSVTIEAGQSTSQTDSRSQVRKRSNQSSSSTLTHELSNVGAGGNLAIATPGAVTIAGANLAAGGSAGIVAGDVNVTGVVDVATEDSVSTTKRSGFLSSKRTTVTNSSVDQTVVGSNIVAGNDIFIDATGAVNIAGSVLSSGNNTDITAAGPVNITSLVENDSSSTETVVKKRSLLGAISGAALFGLSGNNGRSGSTTSESQNTQTNILSSVDAGGNIDIVSTGDAVRIAGAVLNGDGAVSITGQDVTITGVVDTGEYSYSSNSKRSGLLSTTRRTTTQDVSSETAVGSTVSGGTVNITSIRDSVSGAGGNLDIIGSDVVGTGNVNLNADGDINIGTLETTSTENSFDRVKRSGLSIDFRNLSAFAGVSSNRVTNEASTTTNTGSLVGSAEGNLSVNAGRDLTVTGSTLTSPGTTFLTGESVTIQNATDQTDTLNTTRSSSIGITAQVNAPLLPAINGVINSAQIATGSANDRTRAVAGVAGALAVANVVDAAPAAANAIGNAIESGNPKDLLSAFSVDVTAGFSSSRSRNETTDQTVVGSSVSGGDVIIAARGTEGDPASGTINITGSNVNAGRDLTLAAPGAITIAAATETDTLTSSNRSSGFSAGVSIGSGGISPIASANLGRGNASGTDVQHTESIVSAGGTATVVTPGALTLSGSVLDANRVNIAAGSLTIESLQDSDAFRSRQRDISVSGSLTPAQGGGTNGSVSGNVSSSRVDSQFNSVQTQAGINAGSGGFNIDIAGATTLTGGVISSTADPASNTLTTGSLSASDITNSERFRASSSSFGATLSGRVSGPDTPAAPPAAPATGETGTPPPPPPPPPPPSAAIGPDGVAQPANGGNTPIGGSRIPGLGNISPTLPVVQGASGDQSGITQSAIAPGTIIIRAGADGAVDAASQAVANTISRDTAAANAGALTQEFDAARRAEIDQSFAATRELAAQTQVFFANAAREQERERETLAALGVRNTDGSYSARADLTATQLAAFNAAQTEYARLDGTFGAGSPLRIFATALNGAAGGNAAGGLGDLARAAAGNILQSVGAYAAGQIADGLRTRTEQTDANGNVISVTYTANANSEAVRAFLQGAVGCVGQAIGGGDCGSGAFGGAGSVGANLVLNALTGRGNSETVQVTRDANGNLIPRDADPANPLSLEEQQAQTNNTAAIIGILSGIAGLNTASAVTSAVIETENNENAPGRLRPIPAQVRVVAGEPITTTCPSSQPNCPTSHPTRDWGRLGAVREDANGNIIAYYDQNGNAITREQFEAAGLIVARDSENRPQTPEEVTRYNNVGEAVRGELARLIDPNYRAQDDAARQVASNADTICPLQVQCTSDGGDAIYNNLRPNPNGIATDAQVAVAISVLTSTGLPLSDLREFVNFYGGANQFTQTGQSSVNLVAAFNETRRHLDSAGYAAYSTTSPALLQRYINGQPLTAAEERQVALAVSYIDYRARIDRNLSPAEREQNQSFVNTMNELLAGNVLNRNAGAGVVNSFVDLGNLIINGLALAGGPPTGTTFAGELRYYEIIPQANPCTGSNDTPACRSQVDIGYVAGSVGQALIPGSVFTRLGNLRRAAGLSEAASVTIANADNAINIARVDAAQAGTRVAGATDNVAAGGARPTSSAGATPSNGTAGTAAGAADDVADEIVVNGVRSTNGSIANPAVGNTAARNNAGAATARPPVYTDILAPSDRRHILFGDSSGGGHLWPGLPGKTPFPQNWTGDRIIHEIGDIATSPSTTWFAQTGNGGILTAAGNPARWVAFEVRGGIRIRVVYEPATGRIVTGFPDSAPLPSSLTSIPRR